MSAWRESLARVAGLIHRAPPERDLNDELGFHLEMLEQKHRAAGLSNEEARRAARIELGGRAQIAEDWRDQRTLPALEMLAQDLGYAVRMLRRTPGFTLAALLTLALGIGANTAIFTVVDAVVLRPLPYAAPDRLVTIGDAGFDGMPETVGYTTLVDWRARSRAFDSMALMRSWTPTLVAGGEAERLPGVRVSWNYFDMLGVGPAIGRSFRADEDRAEQWRVLILSDGLWRRRFGADPSVIGRTVTMNDRDYRIVGVMPASFEPLISARFYQAARVWAPLGYDTSLPYACRAASTCGRSDG